MTIVEAVFEKGVFRPISPVALTEGSHVEVLVPARTAGSPVRPLTASERTSFGILPHEDAMEISRIVAEEFEQVNPDDWR